MLYPNWKSLTLLVCLTPAWAASAPLVGSDLLPRVVQDEEDKPEELPDKREEVKNLLENLKNHAKARGTQDADAQGVIETLMKEFPQSGPKDRVSIVKGIGQIFKEKRKQAEDGTFDNTLYLAAAYALGEMGPESVAELTSWIGNKTHRSNLLLQEKLIQSLGKTKHPDAVKPLLDLLGNKDFAIEAAGAQALSNFGELEIKARKKVFEEVLKTLMSAKNAMDADVNNQDPVVHKRYNAVSASMFSALQALSGHEEATPEDWQRWWNKNKKEDWDGKTE